MSTADPINPERVFWELRPRLPDDCILSADSGTAANWYARDLKIRRGMMARGSGNLATMGRGVPYAVGGQVLLSPTGRSIALTGDGAMQMNGLNACITVAKYWKEWKDPRWIILVLNNRDLNQVTWEQRVMTGDLKFAGHADSPGLPLRALRRVDRPARHPRRPPRRRLAGLGRGALRGPARACWRRSPTPTYRRCRRTSRWSRHNFAMSLLQGRPRRRRRDPAIVQAEDHGVPPRSISQPDQPISTVQVDAYTIATDAPEADGTLSWSETTIVVVHARSGSVTGLGYTYADVATAQLIESKLGSVVRGLDALSPQGAWREMVRAIRNLGRPGICSMAIAAVDVALWDLKARLLELPLCRLLGAVHDRVPVYGSGGFTSYDDERLAASAQRLG